MYIIQVDIKKGIFSLLKHDIHCIRKQHSNLFPINLIVPPPPCWPPHNVMAADGQPAAQPFARPRPTPSHNTLVHCSRDWLLPQRVLVVVGVCGASRLDRRLPGAYCSQPVCVARLNITLVAPTTDCPGESEHPPLEPPAETCE